MENGEKETLPLPEAVTHLLEECRMVLPGIQALFGFQLIVVFHPTFDSKLKYGEQLLHLGAVGLVGIAVALVMGPAALHRQAGPKEVSQEFIEVASRLLLWSMFPLMLGICLDFFLISRIILHDPLVSCLISLALLIIFTFLWFMLPRFKALRNLVVLFPR